MFSPILFFSDTSIYIYKINVGEMSYNLKDLIAIMLARFRLKFPIDWKIYRLFINLFNRAFLMHAE